MHELRYTFKFFYHILHNTLTGGWIIPISLTIFIVFDKSLVKNPDNLLFHIVDASIRHTIPDSREDIDIAQSFAPEIKYLNCTILH